MDDGRLAVRDVVRVRQLRSERGWSQAELAERSGLGVRTIQRVEAGADPGLDTLRRLAAVFDVDAVDLRSSLSPAAGSMSFAEAIRRCLERYAEFDGLAGRAEYWWFTLAVALVIAPAVAIGPGLTTAVGALVILPWLAVGARRLRDAGQNPWWLLLLLAPVGGPVGLTFLLAMPSKAEEPESSTAHEAGRS